jgi:two-component system, chemotaxis family, response regulator Rcp1
MEQHREGGSGRILLIEDNPADARIVTEAIDETGIASDLTILQYREEFMEFLTRQGRFARAALPDLILLDLNLPGQDGREILAELKKTPDLCMIPVIVLTTSTAEHDVLEVYQLHANCYIGKPLTYQRMLEVIKLIGEFWFKVVRLPGRG